MNLLDSQAKTIDDLFQLVITQSHSSCEELIISEEEYKQSEFIFKKDKKLISYLRKVLSRALTAYRSEIKQGQPSFETIAIVSKLNLCVAYFATERRIIKQLIREYEVYALSHLLTLLCTPDRPDYLQYPHITLRKY